MFPFKRNIRVHIEQFSILESLKQYGYAGIDNRSRVRLFNNGIKTSSLDVVKLQNYATLLMHQ